jgi:hypothetical protein
MDARYHEALALRALLSSIAEQNEALDKGHKADIVLSFPDSTDLLRSMALRISRSRRPARLEPKGLFKTILDEGALDRIKRCAYEKCNRFFWATRMDRSCCQESCANAHRQKLHRERVKHNRRSKKNLKKRNKNG